MAGRVDITKTLTVRLPPYAWRTVGNVAQRRVARRLLRGGRASRDFRFFVGAAARRNGFAQHEVGPYGWRTSVGKCARDADEQTERKWSESLAAAARTHRSTPMQTEGRLRHGPPGRHHRRPRPCEIAAIVTAAAERQQPAGAHFVGELRKPRGGVAVGGGRVEEMRERIVGDAVCAALQNDELGPEAAQSFLDLSPCGEECVIGGARPQRNIEFGAARRARARLFASAGAGLERAAVFVDVGYEYPGVVLDRVEHAVAMMGFRWQTLPARPRSAKWATKAPCRSTPKGWPPGNP